MTAETIYTFVSAVSTAWAAFLVFLALYWKRRATRERRAKEKALSRSRRLDFEINVLRAKVDGYERKAKEPGYRDQAKPPMVVVPQKVDTFRPYSNSLTCERCGERIYASWRFSEDPIDHFIVTCVYCSTEHKMHTKKST